MSKQGLNSLFPMEDISVMGIWELLPHLNNFRVRGEQSGFPIFFIVFYNSVSCGPLTCIIRNNRLN